MRSILSYMAIRIAALIGLMVLFNLLYVKTTWKSDISQHADLKDSLDKYSFNTDLLFLSSSSNYFFQAKDSSHQMISQMIDDQLIEYRVNPIHKGYMHAGMFLTVLENIPDTSSIKSVLVEMNLRSFGAFWVYSDVETLYSIQQLMMNENYPPLLRRVMFAFDFYDNKTYAERNKQFVGEWKTQELQFPWAFEYKYVRDWDQGLARSGKYLRDDGQWDYDKIGQACNIVKAFAFHIDTTNHPRIRDFDAIVDLSRKRGWDLYFVIMPEDYEKAQTLIGNEVPWLMNQAVELLDKRYTNLGVNVINLHNLLGASYFYEPYPTEHYLSSGKKMIADSVVAVIRKTK
jgi:hypothetical protein